MPIAKAQAPLNTMKVNDGNINNTISR